MSATVTVMFCGAAVAITHRNRQVVAGYRFIERASGGDHPITGDTEFVAACSSSE